MWAMRRDWIHSSSEIQVDWQPKHVITKMIGNRQFVETWHAQRILFSSKLFGDPSFLNLFLSFLWFHFRSKIRRFSGYSWRESPKNDFIYTETLQNVCTTNMNGFFHYNDIMRFLWYCVFVIISVWLAQSTETVLGFNLLGWFYLGFRLHYTPWYS